MNRTGILALIVAGVAAFGFLVGFAVKQDGNAVASDTTTTMDADVSLTHTAGKSVKQVARNTSRPALTRRVTVPAGTTIRATLQNELSTKHSEVGDRFTARVISPVRIAGRTAIPAGAQIVGHVAQVQEPGKLSGRGTMTLAYDEVRFDGRSYKLATMGRQMQSKSGTGKDAAIIGGGAAAGGIVGGILGGSDDIAKGAVIGAATGTAASMMTRGPQLKLESGSTLTFSLDRGVTVTASSRAA